MIEQYGYVVDNIKQIKANIAEAAIKAGRCPEDIQLMAVTKTVSAEIVNIAVRQGINLLGENRVQELCEKYDAYEKQNAEIHFIGHLQTNKIGKIIDKVNMIHSLDSLKLANELQRQAKKHNKVIDVLIEINIAGEFSKSGLPEIETEQLVGAISDLSNLKLRGFMTIPPLDADEKTTEHYFARMAEIKSNYTSTDILSMGMSNDYPLAVKHGATIIRIGSAIFGSRPIK